MTRREITANLGGFTQSSTSTVPLRADAALNLIVLWVDGNRPIDLTGADLTALRLDATGGVVRMPTTSPRPRRGEQNVTAAPWSLVPGRHELLLRILVEGHTHSTLVLLDIAPVPAPPPKPAPPVVVPPAPQPDPDPVPAAWEFVGAQIVAAPPPPAVPAVSGSQITG